MDKIKFKEAGNNWFIKIFLDEEGNEASKTPSFKDGKGSGTGLYKEMKAWEAAGNIIEKQYTANELVQKESSDLQKVIESQRSVCIQLLNESECKVGGDPPYPDDVEAWKSVRVKWRDIIKNESIETIPDKPF